MKIDNIGTCPVEIGDYFYKINPKFSKPDYIRVKDIKPKGSGYLITGEYIYHEDSAERIFSDVIFDDPNWVIVKK